jgi:hypothetical protein
MRFSQIKEASVFKKVKNQYVPGYRMAISTKAGGKAITAIQSVVKDFDPAEVLSVAEQSASPTYEVMLSKKTTATYNLARPNGEIIQLQGTTSEIESSLNGVGPAIDPNDTSGKVKMPNKGDTAEALLGGAMFAKLLNRDSGAIGEVDTDSVWKIFDNLTPESGDDYLVRSKDLGGATDKVWFRLKVKNTVKTALKDPSMRKKLTSWLQSPVNYVNSPAGTDYAEEFYKNGTPDELGVISDGLSAQGDKKTDVYTAVKDPASGNVKKELLPTSLKAGAEQFAQHSGGKWAAMKEMFSKLGVTFPATEKDDIAKDYEGLQGKAQQIEAAAKVYEKAAGMINAQFETPADEAKFVKTVAHALRFWATNDDDNVQVVSFGSKGSYDVLQFKVANLVPIMKRLELRAETILTGDNPKLLIKDMKTGGVLFQLRTYLQTKKDGSKYQRNIIEKGPLLAMVADATGKYAKPPEVAAQQNPKATPTTKPQVAPQATTPAVVTPAPQVSSTANTPVPTTASVADTEFAETHGKWQPHNDKHVSELERMLHLAKYSK